MKTGLTFTLEHVTGKFVDTSDLEISDTKAIRLTVADGDGKILFQWLDTVSGWEQMSNMIDSTIRDGRREVLSLICQDAVTPERARLGLQPRAV